jgi:hypothetical protein
MNSLYSESNISSYVSKEITDGDGPAPAPPSGSAPASNPESNPESIRTAPPDVFRYEDYRAFLRARFAELQARDPSFSQRGLARKAGIANPGFFNEVIKGRRRLSPAAAIKMAYGMDLAGDESEFFSILVEYAETREPRAKFSAGKRLLAMRNRKLLTGGEGGAAPAEGLQEIVRELDREWVLRVAGMDVQPAKPVVQVNLQGTPTIP